MTAALKGLRVLDIASLYAAPLAASILADFGADVIKVEPPEGDGFRGTRMWPVVARGKRSLILDLRSEAGQESLRKLVAKADVLVENFPARVLRSRGLDWNTLSSLNPRLVMLSLSCFGQSGPYAERPGSGTIGEAFGGLAHLIGQRDGPPMLPSVALGDAVGAMSAVIGTMTALYARDHDHGLGQQVDASLYEPVLAAIAQSFQFHAAGTAPLRNGSRMAAGTGLRNVYGAADGRFVAISASTGRHHDDLAQLVGAAPESDVDSAVCAWIAARRADEVIATLVERRIPIAPVNDIDALLADPQVIARGSLVRREEAFGDTLVPAPTPRLIATPGSLGSFNPPLDGARATLGADWGVDGF